MKQLALAAIFLAANFSHASVTREWESISNPSIRSNRYEYQFSKLPLSGSQKDLSKMWASDYWARRKGGINYRWNSANPIGFKLKSPSFEEVKLMSVDELAALAPSEKLDILNGQYDYPLVKEVDRGADKGAPLWHGICNGWAPASLNHSEPTPKTLVGANGIRVPFGSSDIKALLSYYYAFKHDVDGTRQIGKRCFLFGPGCDDDLNAGAFHIILANSLGLEGEGFIADVERGRQVWNHAANEYKSTILEDNLSPSKNSAKGTVRRVRVSTVMGFVKSIKENSWYPTNGTEAHINDVRDYEYFLDIDVYGRIIGGDWISHARPDFIWEMEKANSFEGRYSRISELLND